MPPRGHSPRSRKKTSSKASNRASRQIPSRQVPSALQNCSIARALAALGDEWTLLILREAFLGTRRFADFEAELGISKNILARRLRHLLECEVLEAVDAGQYGKRLEYQLTTRGKDLITLFTALRQWGDRWIFGPGAEPVLVYDRRTGKPVPRIRILGEDGAPIRGSDLVLRPGPGATPETLERVRSAATQTSSANLARHNPRSRGRT
jgi:DNA-binding HxlR family transcriptional regulator